MRTLIALVAVAAWPAAAQDFQGMAVGQPVAQIARLGQPAAQEATGPYLISRWTLPGGTQLSITGVQGGTITYLETSRGDGSPPSVGSGLRFGATTRGEFLSLWSDTPASTMRHGRR